MNKTHKFKQTEIGLIPEDWEVKELGEVASYINEKINVKKIDPEKYISTENLIPNKGGITLAQTIPKTGNINKFNLEDILFSNIRTYFKKLWFAKFEGECSTDVLVIRNNKKISPNFLYYFLSQDLFFNYTIVNSKGTKMPRGDKKAIMQFKINLPSLQEQTAIAKILSDLDSKIEILQKQNETLEKIGQALFKHWFVDFEFPDEQGKPYKSSGGEMVESELGMIPKGWEVGKLGDKLKTVLGGTPNKTKPEYWKGDIPWINSGAINAFPIMDFSDTISELGLENSAAKLMPPRTVVLPFVISVGKEVRISILGIESSGNQSVLGILEDEDYSSEFIYNWIQLRKGNLYLSATGGAQQHINKGNVDSMELLNPEIKILHYFNKTVKNFFNKIYLNSKEILTLQKIRDLLLPKLMTGKIRVPLEDQK